MELVMTTLREAALAWIACVEHGSESLGRIAFWIEQLGDKPIADITEQDVDLALSALARRGKLKGGRGRLNPPIATGQPLAPQALTGSSQRLPVCIKTQESFGFCRAHTRLQRRASRSCLKPLIQINTFGLKRWRRYSSLPLQSTSVGKSCQP